MHAHLTSPQNFATSLLAIVVSANGRIDPRELAELDRMACASGNQRRNPVSSHPAAWPPCVGAAWVMVAGTARRAQRG